MGPLEILIVVLIVVAILARNRLPELGRSLGQGLSELRSAVTRGHGERQPEIEDGGEPEPDDADVVDEPRR